MKFIFAILVLSLSLALAAPLARAEGKGPAAGWRRAANGEYFCYLLSGGSKALINDSACRGKPFPIRFAWERSTWDDLRCYAYDAFDSSLLYGGVPADDSKCAGHRKPLIYHWGVSGAGYLACYAYDSNDGLVLYGGFPVDDASCGRRRTAELDTSFDQGAGVADGSRDSKDVVATMAGESFGDAPKASLHRVD